MAWLTRHAWWGLLGVTLLVFYFGVSDTVSGSAADPAIPLGLVGLSPTDLRARSEEGYQLLDFFTRTQGLALTVIGIFSTVTALYAYRRNVPWAWWAIWLLPLWFAGIFALYLVTGVDTSQPPPPPMVSAPILTAFLALIQLVSAPRFFGPGTAAMGDV